MADRTSASLFASFFELLADDPTPQHKAWALKVWDMSRGYDFSDYQMGCDEALLTLGLARHGINPRYPEDGETVLYGPEEA